MQNAPLLILTSVAGDGIQQDETCMDLVLVQPEAPDVRIPGNHGGDGLVPAATVCEEIPHQAGMHYYDFGEITKDIEGLFTSPKECEKRADLLYTYSNIRIAEADGKVAGSFLSYPGDNYKELRHKTFSELWSGSEAMATAGYSEWTFSGWHTGNN